jgi:hypothetical protein
VDAVPRADHSVRCVDRSPAEVEVVAEGSVLEAQLEGDLTRSGFRASNNPEVASPEARDG